MIFVWLIPLLLLPLAYFASKVKVARTVRYWVYSTVFLGTCFWDWNKLCFSNKVADTLFLLLVAFMITEIFWVANRFKRKVIVVFFVLVYVALYVNYFSVWLFSAPSVSRQFFVPTILAQQTVSNNNYRILVRTDQFRKERKITLYKSTGFYGVEQAVGSFTTPFGYYLTPFTFKFQNASNGVKVDIVDSATVVWSLGEKL